MRGSIKKIPEFRPRDFSGVLPGPASGLRTRQWAISSLRLYEQGVVDAFYAGNALRHFHGAIAHAGRSHEPAELHVAAASLYVDLARFHVLGVDQSRLHLTDEHG